LTVLLKVVDDVCPLTLVGCDDADLFRLYSCTLQIEDYFIDSGSFGSVEV
jgi:hypothetical protein